MQDFYLWVDFSPVKELMVELMGIEPTTFSLQSYCSPVELQPHKQGTREISCKLKTLEIAVCAFKWGFREDLNLQPDDYKSTALPIVLRKHMWCPIRDLNPEEKAGFEPVASAIPPIGHISDEAVATCFQLLVFVY